jgi:hypothetical protein
VEEKETDMIRSRTPIPEHGEQWIIYSPTGEEVIRTDNFMDAMISKWRG